MEFKFNLFSVTDQKSQTLRKRAWGEGTFVVAMKFTAINALPPFSSLPVAMETPLSLTPCRFGRRRQAASRRSRSPRHRLVVSCRVIKEPATDRGDDVGADAPPGEEVHCVSTATGMDLG